MAFHGRPSITKRNREQARREKTLEKAERRNQRAAERRDRETGPPGEDPDLIGMTPGPQPRPDED